jgi:hypothetical protein
MCTTMPATRIRHLIKRWVGKGNINDEPKYAVQIVLGNTYIGPTQTSDSVNTRRHAKLSGRACASRSPGGLAGKGACARYCTTLKRSLTLFSASFQALVLVVRGCLEWSSESSVMKRYIFRCRVSPVKENETQAEGMFFVASQWSSFMSRTF